MDSSSARSITRFCGELGIPFDSERFEALLEQSVRAPSIAVVGLVSRGKSTLVNELVGVEVCPVSHKGESVAVVGIANGVPTASAWDESGRGLEISSEVGQFSQRILRSSSPRVRRAELSIPCRLPEGVVIADTPGISDAAGVDTRLEYLNRTWLSSGATGCVAVVSYPPGLARSDRELINEAYSLYRDRLVVVVKATDSSISEQDLMDVASEVKEHVGVQPIVLRSGLSVGTWGSGKTGELDRAISALAARGGEAKKDALSELADVMSLVVHSVGGVQPNKMVALDRLRGLAGEIDHGLLLAVEKRVNELRQLVAERARAEQRVEQQKKRNALDRQANEFRGLLPTTTNSWRYEVHGPTVRELFDLAKEGSLVAGSTLAKALTNSEDRNSKYGVNLGDLVSRFDSGEFVQMIGECRLSDVEFVKIIEYADQREVTDYLASSAVRAHVNTVSFQRLKDLIEKCRFRPVVQFLVEPALEACITDIKSARANCRDLNGVSPLLEAMSRFVQFRGRDVCRIADPGVLRRCDAKFDEVKRLGVGTLVNAFYSEEKHILGRAHEITRQEVSRRCSIWMKAREVLQGASVADAARIEKSFRTDGDLMTWAGLCMAARSSALEEVTKRQQVAATVYPLSFVLWFVSIAMAVSSAQDQADGGEGWPFFVWLVSFGLWLWSRKKRLELDPWQSRFRVPRYPPSGVSGSFPLIVQDRAEAGWYADPCGRFQYRYWSGETWTNHVSRHGVTYQDPPVM